MTNDFNGRPPSSVTLPIQADRAFARRLVATAGAALLLAGVSSTAFAAPGQTSADSTEANVEVLSAIGLTALTPDFLLTGLPGATVAGLGAVTMNVSTNNLAGYAVTVQSASATLDPAAVGNPDTIPIGALSVRETGSTAYTPVSDAAPVTVHTQGTRSAQGGDTISNDYRVVIPFVNEDTYTTTLNYIATTL